LDFGGGTGLDLPWLLNSYDRVFFIEPSVGMRYVANKLVNSMLQKADIVEENLDFHNWSENDLPMVEKMDGVLVNFAVLNCIPDIHKLFEKMSLICAVNCKIVATVIATEPLNMMKMYSAKMAFKRLLNIRLTTQNSYRGVSQEVYLYTKPQLRSAAANYFEIISYARIKSSHFAMVILSKK
jgi:hypothetical protein